MSETRLSHFVTRLSEKTDDFTIKKLLIECIIRYYKKPMSESQIKNLRTFHNYVKSLLIKNAVIYEKSVIGIKRPIRLLDIAVGRGGDLHKWIRYGVKEVIGFDMDEESITKADARIKERQGPISIDLFKASATNPNTKILLSQVVPNNYKFDIISCQFALHYFFDKPESLETFFNICNTYSHPGTLLIGTSIDGGKIYDRLLNHQTYKQKVLELEKHYNTHKIKSKDQVFENVYGNAYTYNLKDEIESDSYFQEEKSNEFLLDLKALERVARDHGFYLLKSFRVVDDKNKFLFNLNNYAPFRYWYSKYYKKNLSKDEQEASFFNFSFVFVRK